MTQVKRITTDFYLFVLFDPPNPRHRRSTVRRFIHTLEFEHNFLAAPNVERTKFKVYNGRISDRPLIL
jgi:hypothetical protein